jgi:hypothetical protein
MFRFLFLILVVTFSVSFAPAQEKKEPVKFFEFERISDKLLKEKLVEYKDALKPYAHSIIINYGTNKEILRREKQLQKQIALVFRGYDPPRMTFVRNIYTGKTRTVLWIVGEGAELPKP